MTQSNIFTFNLKYRQERFSVLVGGKNVNTNEDDA